MTLHMRLPSVIHLRPPWGIHETWKDRRVGGQGIQTTPGIDAGAGTACGQFAPAQTRSCVGVCVCVGHRVLICVCVCVCVLLVCACWC
jgi:hypothetical protein